MNFLKNFVKKFALFTFYPPLVNEKKAVKGKNYNFIVKVDEKTTFSTSNRN